MTETESVRIDALTIAVGKLQGGVEAMMAQWAMQENHASAGRAIIHQKIDALTREVGNISVEVKAVTQDMAELKNDIDDKITPALEAHNLTMAHRAGRSEGIAWSTRLFYALIVGIASAVGFAIHEALLYFGHSPIHAIPGVH